MFVYLMGLADILAAIMLVTGLRPETMLKFAVFMLIYTAFFSFVRPSLFLIVGAVMNIIAAILLLKSITIGHIATYVIIFQLFKGYISFWELEFVRNFTIGLFYGGIKGIQAVFRLVLLKTFEMTFNKFKFILTKSLYFGNKEVSLEGKIIESASVNANNKDKLSFSSIVKRII